MRRPAPAEIRRGPAERAAAWVATGPLGVLYSVVLDVLVLWTRLLAAWVRGRSAIR